MIESLSMVGVFADATATANFFTGFECFNLVMLGPLVWVLSITQCWMFGEPPWSWPWTVYNNQIYLHTMLCHHVLQPAARWCSKSANEHTWSTQQRLLHLSTFQGVSHVDKLLVCPLSSYDPWPLSQNGWSTHKSSIIVALCHWPSQPWFVNWHWSYAAWNSSKQSNRRGRYPTLSIHYMQHTGVTIQLFLPLKIINWMVSGLSSFPAHRQKVPHGCWINLAGTFWLDNIFLTRILCPSMPGSLTRLVERPLVDQTPTLEL